MIHQAEQNGIIVEIPSFSVENSGKYLGYSGTDNKAFWLAAGNDWTENEYLLDITWNSDNSCYYVTLNSAPSRKLQRMASNDWFAFYTSSQQGNLIFVPATVDTRTAVTLSFAEDAVSFTTADYDTFFGQDVTATPDVAAITGHLNWSKVDNDNVIDDFDDGVLTLTGNEGSATVTVAFAGDEDYRPAEASYTIIVSAASGPEYVLVSTANDVVAGDYIITWDNTYYLPSGSTSGTNPAVGTGITVANSKITNTVTSDMVWTFTGDNTNGFTISDGTNILHSTNAAQGISITTNSTRKWTVSVDGTYGMLLRGDDGGSRNLAVYNSGSWRYYATGNSYTGTLRLYKYSGPSITWNLESIAITTGPTKTEYTEGESFDPAGMVVTGHFVDADDNTNTKDEAVTGYTISPDGPLATTDDHVTITYQGQTANQAITVNAAPQANDGTLEHPYSASEACALAIGGDTGSYYIYGTITKIQNQYSAGYGTANFWIDENGAAQNVFEGYKIKYFGNQDWVDGNAQLAVDDEVVIYGTLTYYNSTTPETSSGYLVSLNGTTKGLTLAAPTVTTNTANSAKEITVSWAAATGTDSAISYVVTCGAQTYNANAAGSHTFTMSDYGTYSVSVAASASDAISATVTSSASLVDPNAGEPTVYTIQWGSAYNESSVSSYTASWNATKDVFTVNMANFNNNNNDWDYVKCGRKNNASTATIITDSAISEAIKTVTITIDALTASNITSITLYVSDSKTSGWASAGTFTKAVGNQSVTIASPAANKYYKLEFVCTSGSSNGLLTLSKAQFSTN